MDIYIYINRWIDRQILLQSLTANEHIHMYFLRTFAEEVEPSKTQKTSIFGSGWFSSLPLSGSILETFRGFGFIMRSGWGLGRLV